VSLQDIRDGVVDRHRREATAGLTTHPEILMIWPVHGLDDGHGWRNAD
jgi:hypothetical protein